MHRDALFKTLLLAMISISGLLIGPGVNGAWAQGGAWTKSPAILLLGPDNDPRIAATSEAVAFWNRTFSELGSSFRLGAISRSTKTIPAAYLQSLSTQVLGRGWSGGFPDDIEALPGDIVVALSDQNFVSFAAYWKGPKALVAIKGLSFFPLTLPNVPRNVIAHELGHVIGLRHNADPANLMCGRPASCRPDAFQSATSRFFPLTDSEKAQLVRMYPANWTSR